MTGANEYGKIRTQTMYIRRSCANQSLLQLIYNRFSRSQRSCLLWPFVYSWRAWFRRFTPRRRNFVNRWSAIQSKAGTRVRDQPNEGRRPPTTTIQSPWLHKEENCLRLFSKSRTKFPFAQRLPRPRPPLQNKLWNVLFRGRFYPVCLTGDLRKTFLQVRFRPWAFNLHVRCSAFYQFSPS